MFIRPHAQFIINSMKDKPEDWIFGDHTCGNKENDISLWTSNGFWFMDTYPNTDAFNLVEKWVISKLKGKTNILGKYRKSLKTNKVKNNG